MNENTDTTAAAVSASGGTNWYQAANQAAMALRHIEALAGLAIELVIEAYVGPVADEGHYQIEKRNVARCEALLQAIEVMAVRAEERV